MYSALDSGRAEIRLATIKAGSRDDEIQCAMTHVSLDDFPNYEALSYVWGDPNNRLPILLDGNQIQATKNLELALRYLRSASEDRFQVQLMGDIYRRARRVVCWLGEEDDEGRAATASWLVAEAERQKYSHDWITESILEDDKTNFMRRCFAHLGIHLHRGTWDYWTRTWITQEIALSQDGILQCGNTIIPFEPLTRLCDAIHDVFWKGTDLPKRAVEVAGLSGFRALINALAPLRDHEIATRVAADTCLLDLLIMNHRKKATDPRDKVYGLLGLADDATTSHPGVRVDYRRSVRDVFMGAAQAIVDTSCKLDVLCVSCPEIPQDLSQEISGARRADLPTWVPDWNLWTGPLILKDTHRLITGAAGSSPACVEFRLDDGIMLAAGFCVGTVSACGMTNPTRNLIRTHGAEFYRDVFGVVASWHDLLETVPGYSRELDVLFFRTITLGGVAADVHMDEMDRPSMDESNTEDERALIRSALLEQIQGLCEEKAFFLVLDSQDTEAAVDLGTCLLMGVGLSGIMEGDVVCVLLGCFLPVILRPLDDGRYAFVAPAYLHNLMNGAAISGLENGDYTLDSFELV